ncbi:nitrilase-related carbon-nitrogen hydrolase [Membranihabitans maritimus]|uniref:nitrilase-related carbon-nitrogen hydrolase n=1 Tax=Membranihabitans maritimus TaxID=2904244 RepID=UPI001F2DA868|nr:nitrilase-related carbon-nitrogen hydrolase [Membranihabitans maritimus]
MHNSNGTLKASIIQYPIVWLEKEQNLNSIENILKEDYEDSDIIVLPEMFNTGFHTVPDEIAESISDPTVQWMKSISCQYKASICGSICVQNTDGNYTNTFLFVSNGKIIHRYDKKHLFSFADESRLMTPGKKRENFLIRANWNVRPFICYDVRFPVWLRNDNNYDLLLGVSNFPHARITAWKSLCIARAIENQCYLMGVNGMGSDHNGIYYSGHSLCIGPDGEVLLDTKEKTGLFSIEINKTHLNRFRAKYPFLNDRDEFTILGNESN